MFIYGEGRASELCADLNFNLRVLTREFWGTAKRDAVERLESAETRSESSLCVNEGEFRAASAFISLRVCADWVMDALILV